MGVADCAGAELLHFYRFIVPSNGSNELGKDLQK